MPDRAVVESCEVCGYVWARVGAEEIAPRCRVGAARVSETLRAFPDLSVRRPGLEVWSALEYACHLRDVLYHLRDRLVIAVVEDAPSFKPLYRDERVDLGLYRAEEPGVVAVELGLAAELFIRTFSTLDEAQLSRPCQYTFPTVSTRTVLWMAQQLVHEIEHHGADIDAGIARLRS